MPRLLTARMSHFFTRLTASPDADIIVNGHRETWPVRSKQFTWFLRKAYYDETGGAPGGESLSSALELVEARAQFGGIERTVHVRVAEFQGRIVH